jgi:putative peptidoglycan lipid II flippase
MLTVGFIRKQEFHYSLLFDYKHPGIIKILKLMLPLVLGMIVYRAAPVFDRYLLSGLIEGSISYISYANKITSVIPAVIVSGISIAIFPIMAKYAAEGKTHQLVGVMSKGIRMLIFLSIPITLFMMYYSKEIILLIYERGAFTSKDTLLVSNALYIYLLAMPAGVLGTIVGGQGYYVLKDTRTVAIVGVIEMLLYVGISFALLKYYGYLALPIANVIQVNMAVIVLGLILRYKLGVKGGKKILFSIISSTITAITSLIFIILLNNILFFNAAEMIIALMLIYFLIYLLISRYIVKSEEVRYIFSFINIHIYNRE